MADDNDLRARNGKGQFSRTVEGAARDAEAARLHAQGWTYQAIARELGIDKSSAIRAVQRAVREVVQGPAEEVLRLHTSRLEYAYAKAVEIAEADHIMVSHGKIVCDADGIPLRDHAPVLAALREARQTLESFRTMMGLNQPVKVDATVTQVTQQDLELQEMLREAKARTELEEQQILGGADG
ncbi:helix-turn-helix domain-containing protein [Streptomyces lavendulae]|nr:helix-turn-helix domain-containing protein [Streptomyces lavendulae]TXJ78619.1 helix-turn-helix domain-containing protein [Streptomyces lavendulae]